MRKKEILARSIFGSLSPARLVADRLGTTRLSILAYHRINTLPDENYIFQEETVSSTPQMFRRQLQFLKKHCFVTNFSGLQEILDAGEDVPNNTVIITFDDGYLDNYDIAFPILDEFNMTAVVYVVTDCIDTGEIFWFEKLSADVMRMPEQRLVLLDGLFEFDVRAHNRRTARRAIGDLVRTLSDEKRLQALHELSKQAYAETSPMRHERMIMNWGEINQLVSGGIEIGSHTVSHPFLSRLTDREIEVELSQSKVRIETETAKPVLSLSYPTGGKDFYDDRVLSQAKASGYSFAVSYEHDSADFDASLRYELPRIHVETDVSLPLFKANILLPQIFVSRGPNGSRK